MTHVRTFDQTFAHTASDFFGLIFITIGRMLAHFAVSSAPLYRVAAVAFKIGFDTNATFSSIEPSRVISLRLHSGVEARQSTVVETA